jgi:uncharacterized protein involved in exopolysaccharide biosynthesis
MNKMKNPSVELILSFTQIGAMLRARRYLIFIVTMIAVLGAGITSMLLPKTYVATADIFIDYRVNDPIGGRQFHPLQDESYLQTQFDVIKSVQVAERVIAELHLQNSADSRRLIARYGEQGWLTCARRVDRKNIEVAPHKNSRVIGIQYSAGTPQHAKEVVNAVVKSYIDLSLEMMNAPARARKDQYNAQLETLSRQMDEIQKTDRISTGISDR